MFSLSHTHFLTPSSLPQFPPGHQSLCGLWQEQATHSGTKTQIMGWRELLSGLMSQVCVWDGEQLPLCFPSPSTADQISGYLIRLGWRYVAHSMYEWMSKAHWWLNRSLGGGKWPADNTLGHTLHICSYLLCWIQMSFNLLFSVNIVGIILWLHVKAPDHFFMSFFSILNVLLLHLLHFSTHVNRSPIYILPMILHQLILHNCCSMC